MPRTTRSNKPALAKATASPTVGSSSKYSLVSKQGPVPHIFILPSKATEEARIVTLPNPRTAQPARYLACPKTGIYEFKKIAAPKSMPRSWLIETSLLVEQEQSQNNNATSEATMTTSADLYLATPIDPLFLLLPSLADSKTSKGTGDKKRLFLSADDYFDNLPEECSHLSELLRWESTRALLQERLSVVCDAVDAGDESMFRLNETKLTSLILQKARDMSSGSLPPSMEEHFVKRPLEAPVLIQKRDMNSIANITPANDDSELSMTQPEATESQSSVASTDAASTPVSQPSTAATSFAEDGPGIGDVSSATEASPDIVKLQRSRVAFNFICANYIPPLLANQLQAALASGGQHAIDYTPLDEYLAKLSKLRSDALSTRSAGDYSRKHGRDEEEDEIRAEKKRKLEEEKKRKANESRGVKNLKKVNTTGMMKLSSFFKKK